MHELAQYKTARRANLDPNSILPHTREYEDEPYWLGDVYEPERTAAYEENWRLPDRENRPYLQHIRAISPAWPDLRWLANWMEVGTTPLKWKLIRDQKQIIQQRAKKSKVAVVSFEAGCAPTVDSLPLDEPERLSSVLRDHDDPKYQNVHRLYIIEDLSRETIEILGSKFDIDPLFFRQQISDYWWYNMQDPWVELPELQISARNRPFFFMRHLQSRYFRTQESYTAASHEAGRFNILRRLDTSDMNNESFYDPKGSCVALVRSKTSFWWRKAEPGKHGSIGVLLVDPTVQNGFPLWMGYRNFQPTPSMASKDPVEAPPGSKSYFDALIYWSRRVPEEKIRQMQRDPRVMLFDVCRIQIAEWLTICRYITARLRQVEWEIENPDFQNDPGGINTSGSTLRKLQPYRRNVPLYKAMMDETLTRLFPPQNSGPPHAGVDHNRTLAALEEDFRIVQKSIDGLSERIERIVSVASAVISIEESRRAMSQNQYLGRLSYLAVVFAPLSFVSSFFSMTADVRLLKETFWIYFVIVIPFIIIIFGVIDYARFVKWTKKLFGH